MQPIQRSTMLKASDLIMIIVVLAVHGIRRFNCPRLPSVRPRKGQGRAPGQESEKAGRIPKDPLLSETPFGPDSPLEDRKQGPQTLNPKP